ncbi:6-phospho-beta-glucosidase [Brachybacterium phenoliresistens]|uniref:6-phospho-beta-glucosidase n=1 Tax=Brachybacterium phenoliresistens TaxID=396014 RepID=Z9JVG3_9MICO|nr:6-phospho-beta-glucosidase [Brachybacterium phenoliresistens]EWS81791.1 6-phospho-beta-glucosidase [Brachybacterium phenoliresistens]
MKLTILGGGGFRVPLVYEAVAARATGLVVDEVALHDVDPERLATIGAVAAQLGEELAASGRAPHPLPRLVPTTDLREAVAGADFVFSAVRVGGAQGRTVDERVALDLGLLGQETIGPGGLAYALRTIPVALDVARTIAELAPIAWTINFTNPAGIVTEAMRTVLGDRVVGICDTPIGLVRRVGRLLGADVDAMGPDGTPRIGVDYVGLNHLGWLRAITVDGEDRLPGILADDAALDAIEEARLIGPDWVRTMGALPNEYLFYYLFTEEARSRIAAAEETRGEFLAAQQGRFYEAAGDSCCASPLSAWRATLHEREATYMAETRDEERREEDVAGGGYQEVALRLMTALATGTPARMILDVGNGRPGGGRIVPELPPDLVLEVPCVVDGEGVHPQQVGPVSLGQLGMMARLRAAERAILEAARHGQGASARGGEEAARLRSLAREKAWEGFSTHPLVDSPELGRALLDGYVAGHPEIAALLEG